MVGRPKALRVALLACAFFRSGLLLCQSTPVLTTSSRPAAAESSHPELLVLVRQKNWRQVVEVADVLRSKFPNDAQVDYWLGIAHLQLHEPVEAVLTLRSAEKLGLNSARFHEDLGLAYYDLNQFVLFEQQMQAASWLEPRDSKPYYYLGMYRLTIRSDVARALHLFEVASQLNPDDWKSLYQQGNCLEQLGKLDEARQRYVDAIRFLEKSGDHFGWPYQGIARLMKDENPQSALDFATKAVNLEPSEASNHRVLSDVYQRLGRLPKAIQEAELATAENPTDAASHYALYKLYRQTGDSKADKELKLFDQVTKIYGSN